MILGTSRAIRVFAYPRPADLRKGYDGLYGLVQTGLGRDPLSGELFLFVTRCRNRAKVLWWERNGYCLLYKRLHRAMFRVPQTGDGSAASIRDDGRELAALLERYLTVLAYERAEPGGLVVDDELEQTDPRIQPEDPGDRRCPHAVRVARGRHRLATHHDLDADGGEVMLTHSPRGRAPIAVRARPPQERRPA